MCQLTDEDIDLSTDEVDLYRQWLYSVHVPKLLKTLPSYVPSEIFGRAYAKLSLSRAQEAAVMIARKPSRPIKVRQSMQKVFKILDSHIKDEKSVIWTGSSVIQAATKVKTEPVPSAADLGMTEKPKSVQPLIKPEKLRKMVDQIKEAQKSETADLLLMLEIMNITLIDGKQKYNETF